MSSDVSDLMRLRVGTGLDVHGFVEGGRLVLAGVDIPHTHGLEGHSDADLVAHAVTDALLGGAGMADIGTYFPSEDASLEGADSMDLLRQVVAMLDERGCEVVNVDCVVAMQAPKLAPHREAMNANLAAVIGIDVDRVTVRATTTDHLGFVGRREGAAAIASCLVLRGE
ncbi:MAG: 2-C-methyl-D-erythritol 2,4-cyclodiphosphate synthase [Thermoleophilia bacterium]|nr:2-C-methyl-D-erythritol 2,4-cyclodiphosphate synthase [Thermoleophilia bacterium]